MEQQTLKVLQDILSVLTFIKWYLIIVVTFHIGFHLWDIKR